MSASKTVFGSTIIIDLLLYHYNRRSMVLLHFCYIYIQIYHVSCKSAWEWVIGYHKFPFMHLDLLNQDVACIVRCNSCNLSIFILLYWGFSLVNNCVNIPCIIKWLCIFLLKFWKPGFIVLISLWQWSFLVF